jgi:hypothetical protein
MEQYNIDIAQITKLLKEYPKDKKFSTPFIDIAKGKFKYKKKILRWLQELK